MCIRVAATVILYNPDEISLLLNISSYINDVDKLYVIDNSDFSLSSKIVEYFLSINHIEYINLRGNKGIAYALNYAAISAIKAGYDWLMTMDQDSKATPSMVNKLMSFVYDNRNKHLGIVAARPIFTDETVEVSLIPKYEYVDVVISSGNVINLAAYEEIGGFENKLFIDSVDTDFCLSLHLFKYKIIQLNTALFLHRLGDCKRKYFLGFIKMTPTFHSVVRRYYITRNRYYLFDKYKYEFRDWIRREKYKNYKEFIMILLYEPNKWKKVLAIYKGWKDARKGVFGGLKTNL